ncbi:MAG: CpaF family protein, partial [Bacillota bacterium]
LTGVTFKDDEHLLEVIGRIVAPLGRRLDRASPYVDARLPDGSRVNAIIPPLSLKGPVLTVRKFPGRVVTLPDLVELQTLTPEMASFLKSCVQARLNIVISGGTGSGKTTTLGALCSAASPCDRIITIEDAAELRIDLPHVIALESRPPNIEGKGSVSIRNLLRNALRMRPDRIIIGEVRGPEAYDLLQALNTGHMGSMSTVHANSVTDAVRRLENMVLSSGESIPHEVVSEELRSAVDLLIHQERIPTGPRKVTDVSLVVRSGGRSGKHPVCRVFGWEPEAVCGVAGGRFIRHTTARVPEVTEKFRLCGMSIEDWLGGGDL